MAVNFVPREKERLLLVRGKLEMERDKFFRAEVLSFAAREAAVGVRR